MNTIDLLILGVLSDKKPRNGYQIKRTLRGVGAGIWASLGKSSIYSSLKQMAHKRFIEIVPIDGVTPGTTTTYQITYKGRKTFRDQFKTSTDMIQHQDPFKAMLGLLPSLPKDEQIDVLESRGSVLELISWGYRNHAKTHKETIPAYIVNNNELFINLYQTEIAWINNTVERIKNNDNFL